MTLISAAAGALATAALGTFAVAQQKMQQIRVEASHNVVTEQTGRTYAGIPIKTMTLSYEVNLDDLDLSTAAGETEAEKRINNAAMAACKEVARVAPSSMPADAECATKAARGPVAQVRAAAAGKGPGK